MFCIRVQTVGSRLQWASVPPLILFPTLQDGSLQFRSVVTRELVEGQINFGTTWYHGKLFTLRDFPTHLVQKLGQQMSARPRGPPQLLHGHKGKRISVVTWNPGGFSQSGLIELRLWLKQNPMDIVIIPETRWSFQNHWSDDQWSYIHSAAPEHRSAGLLVMISKRLIPADRLGFEEIQAGRILHVRLHFAVHNVDLLALYQYADYSTGDSAHKRHKFWLTLDQCLHALPNRNQLICGGDLNCSLPTATPWVGSSHFRWQGGRSMGSQHRDSDQLLNILRRHQLVALNTWDETIGPTYFHDRTASRIDFLFGRLAQCDGLSKQAALLPHASFVPNNRTHHFPLICTFKHRRVVFQKPVSTKACNFAQRNQCRIAASQETAEWLQLSHHVAQTCTRLHSYGKFQDDVIHKLHTEVIPFFQARFSGLRVALPRADHVQLEGTISNKWTHRKALRVLASVPRPNMHTCFQAWFHWCKCRLLQRLQQRQARQARLNRFRDLCIAVDEAAATHDSHAMFQVIRKFSPKQPLATARLRTPDGGIADKYTAHALLVAYVAETWKGPSELPLLHPAPPGVPFTKAAMEQAIMSMHPSKSVADRFFASYSLEKCST